MKKGFTLIEVMATIVILAVILLIAVPIYNGVRENINESIYNSKIEEVLSKAETFASENNAFVFDVKTLIENGEISADNETGAYMDPRTNRDMRCDILNAVYKENRYEVSITESDVCYDLEELENLYGMVELKLYDEAGSEIEKLENTDWLRNQEIHVRYEFKEEYQEYANSVESLLWTGEQEKSCTTENLNECNEYIVNTEEIKNVVVGLEVRVNMNGASMVNTVRKNILVDLQRPSVIDGSIVINNEISTNNERRVEYEISDGSGSGVRYTSIVKEKTCNGQEYEENKQSASDGIQSIYLGNGDYYICVEDQVGNRTRDEDLENPNNQIHVEGVDQSIPVISKFEVKSTTSSYNALTTNLSIEASDDSGSNGLQMCISNTGYLQGCSWEKYSSSKSWKVSCSLDGGGRTVYLSIQDSAGNIVNREAKYTVYKDCSNQTKVYTESNYGTCSKTCGGGLQYRAYQMKDTKTGTVCKTAKDSKTCNTQSCNPTFTMINGSPRSFDQIVPLNSTKAVGINGGYPENDTTYEDDSPCRRRECYNSWIETTVMTRNSNGTISFGPTQRILSGNSGLGYKFFSQRVDDNRIIIFGQNSFQRYSSGNTDLDYTGAALIRINGTSSQVLSFIKLKEGRERLDAFGCNGTECNYYVWSHIHTNKGKYFYDRGKVYINGNTLSGHSQYDDDAKECLNFTYDIENYSRSSTATGNCTRDRYFISHLDPNIEVVSGYRQQFKRTHYYFSINGTEFNELAEISTFCRLSNQRFVVFDDRDTKTYYYKFYKYDQANETITNYYSITKPESYGKLVPIGGDCYAFSDEAIYRITA